MALFRSLPLSNRYISKHVLLLLRFYLAQFCYLGLMRLLYEESRNEMRLTYWSVTVSRMIGLWCAYFFTLALLDPYPLMLHIQLLGFICFLLIQPRRVVEVRTRLMNQILRLSPQLYRLCRLIDLIGIVLTLLLKSFELVNVEMAAIDESLCLEILRPDFGAIQRLQKRQILLQRLHRSYVQVNQETIDCLSPQLILILLYNLSTIYTLSSGEWRRILQMGVIVNNLRSLLHTLDDLVAISKAPQNTSWMHLSQLLQFKEVLATHGWLFTQLPCYVGRLMESTVDNPRLQLYCLKVFRELGVMPCIKRYIIGNWLEDICKLFCLDADAECARDSLVDWLRRDIADSS